MGEPVPLALVNNEFLRAGIVLYVDAEGFLTGVQCDPHETGQKDRWAEMEKLLAGRTTGMKHFLIKLATAKG